LKIAKQRNYQNILIIEDDIVFKDKEYFSNVCNKIFDQKFDVFMLGVNVQKYEHFSEDFLRIKYGHSLVGYSFQ
jgi:GR25 family glycosyltransferase involved in LPS biosynthesis